MNSPPPSSTRAPQTTKSPAHHPSPNHGEHAYQLGSDEVSNLRSAANGTPGLFRELVSDAAACVRQLCTSIQEALRLRDTQSVALAAHSLKGLARQFGAAELARAAGELERVATVHDIVAADRLLPDLVRTGQMTAAALERIARTDL